MSARTHSPTPASTLSKVESACRTTSRVWIDENDLTQLDSRAYSFGLTRHSIIRLSVHLLLLNPPRSQMLNDLCSMLDRKKRTPAKQPIRVWLQDDKLAELDGHARRAHVTRPNLIRLAIHRLLKHSPNGRDARPS
jgi:hypothetical protein